MRVFQRCRRLSRETLCSPEKRQVWKATSASGGASAKLSQLLGMKPA